MVAAETVVDVSWISLRSFRIWFGTRPIIPSFGRVKVPEDRVFWSRRCKSLCFPHANETTNVRFVSRLFLKFQSFSLAQELLVRSSSLTYRLSLGSMAYFLAASSLRWPAYAYL